MLALCSSFSYAQDPSEERRAEHLLRTQHHKGTAQKTQQPDTTAGTTAELESSAQGAVIKPRQLNSVSSTINKLPTGWADQLKCTT